MAQIWLHVGLSVILWLSTVIKCDVIIDSREERDKTSYYYDYEYRGEVSNKTENRCHGSDNRPIFYRNCYHPSSTGAAKYCHYYVLFGKKTTDSKRVFKQEHKIPKTRQPPIVITAELPKNSGIDDFLIDLIAVNDLDGWSNVLGHEICITKGGIGYKFVEIVIKGNREWYNRGFGIALYGSQRSPKN